MKTLLIATIPSVRDRDIQVSGWGDVILQPTCPCIVIMKAVLERVHTSTWSTFCGFACTLSTERSAPASAAGGRKEARQSHVLASHTLTVLSLDPVITCMRS